MTQGDTGRPPLAHDIQRHCGRRHAPLVNGGGRGGGGPIGPCVFYTDPSNVLIRRRWPDCVDAGRTTTPGFQRHHRPL